MKILPDECVDSKLSRLLTETDVTILPKIDWDRIRNGELLKKAQSEFDVLITSDRNPSTLFEVLGQTAKSGKSLSKSSPALNPFISKK